ncbi:MAG: hypothetical protein IPL20_00125 [Saprospiraceae bacterium]|nr:hypothetical protein [Saprospiraceae bacterium]
MTDKVKNAGCRVAQPKSSPNILPVQSWKTHIITQYFTSAKPHNPNHYPIFYFCRVGKHKSSPDVLIPQSGKPKSPTKILRLQSFTTQIIT